MKEIWSTQTSLGTLCLIAFDEIHLKQNTKAIKQNLFQAGYEPIINEEIGDFMDTLSNFILNTSEKIPEELNFGFSGSWNVTELLKHNNGHMPILGKNLGQAASVIVGDLSEVRKREIVKENCIGYICKKYTE